MRAAPTAAVLTCGMVLLSGCTADPAPAPPVVPSGAAVAPPTRSVDPVTVAACRDVRVVNRTYTARFTTQLRTAGAALDREDRPAAEAATGAIRSTFVQWSTALRGQAGRLTDPDLTILITQYAGAVDATIARVRTSADLDKLYTFTEKELDVTANMLAETCP